MNATKRASGQGHGEPPRSTSAGIAATWSGLAGALAAAVFGWAPGCGSTSAVSAPGSGDAGPGTRAQGDCTAGAQVACACNGGGSGTQICNSAGTAYGLCACPAASDAGGSSSDGGSGAPDAGSPSDGGSPSGNGDAGRDAGVPGPCGGEPTPAPSVAAGFTTCSYDYDFSQSKYATESSWLDWNNSNPDLAWHNGWPGGLSHFPDGNVFQTTDPTSGQTVLDLRWDQSFDGQQTGNNSFLSIQTIMNGGTSASGSDHGVTFPNFYSETVYRIDDDSANGSNTSGPDGVWTWQIGGGQEFDFAELYGTAGGFGDNGTGGGGFTWVSYQGGIRGDQNLPKNWSPTGYHKYGTLTTTNGSNARSTCTWIDGAFQSCVATDDVSDNPNWLVIWVGGSGAGATQLPTTNLLLQYVRIWSCPSWNTEECDGATQVQQTQNGTTLTYWKP